MKKTTTIILFLTLNFLSSIAMGADAAYYMDGKKLKSKPAYLVEGQRIMVVISSKNKDAKYAKGYINADQNGGAAIYETGNLKTNAVTLEQTIGKREIKSGYVVFNVWFSKNAPSKNTQYQSADYFAETIPVMSKKKLAKENSMTDDEKDARSLRELGIKEYSGSGTKGSSR